MLTQRVYTVGTSPVTVVAPTTDAARYSLKNLQPAEDIGSKARKGQVLSLSQKFQVSGNTDIYFSLLTGSMGMQFDYYRIVSENHNVTAQLIEGCTVTTTGNAFPAYNLNRNFADTFSAEFKAASAVTGGTVVSQEVIIASQSTGGVFASDKILTLKPDTQYAMRFDNTETGTTEMFLEIGFSEIYNGFNDIWLGDDEDSFVLHGGEEITLYMLPQEIINATAGSEGCKLAVMRQG